MGVWIVARCVLTMIGLGLLGGCIGPQQPASPPAIAGPTAVQPPPLLPAAELRALYATAHREDGVVLRGSHTGAHWTKWTKPDGTMHILAGHGVFTDRGHFAVSGDQFCSSWGTIDAGRETCMRIAKDGPDTYVTYDLEGFSGSRFRVSWPPPDAAE